MASLNIYEFADSGAPLEAEVPSTWRGRAALADSDAQTDEISYAESDTQTKRPVEISTQTEPLDDGVGEAKRGEASLDFDGWTPAPDVADFLGRVAPIMNAHLERNAVSHAFDGERALGASPRARARTVLRLLVRAPLARRARPDSLLFHVVSPVCFVSMCTPHHNAPARRL